MGGWMDRRKIPFQEDAKKILIGKHFVKERA